MISQLASVFSSQGVVLQGTGRTAVPRNDEEAPEQPIPGAQPVDFAAVFDQAAARLELSGLAVKAAEEAARGRTAADPDAREEEPGTGRTLTPEQREQVEKLEERDREVRAHEQAHASRAGGYAQGGPRYEYQNGPDGKQYAVGGHVDIDTSPVPGDPQATLQKARVIQAAALAPAEPSGADRAVAASAVKMAQDALKQMQAERSAEVGEGARRGPAGHSSPYARARPETGRFLDTLA